MLRGVSTSRPRDSHQKRCSSMAVTGSRSRAIRSPGPRSHRSSSACTRTRPLSTCRLAPPAVDSGLSVGSARQEHQRDPQPVSLGQRLGCATTGGMAQLAPQRPHLVGQLEYVTSAAHLAGCTVGGAAGLPAVTGRHDILLFERCEQRRLLCFGRFPICTVSACRWPAWWWRPATP